MVGPVPPITAARRRRSKAALLAPSCSSATTVERSRPQARPQGGCEGQRHRCPWWYRHCPWPRQPTGPPNHQPAVAPHVQPGPVVGLAPRRWHRRGRAGRPLFNAMERRSRTVLHGPPSRWFHPGELSEVMVRNEQNTLRAPPSPERHQRCYARCESAVMEDCKHLFEPA